MLKKLFKFGGDSNFGKLGNTTITIIGVTIIVFVWHLIAKYEIIPTKILPDPFKVIGSISGLITENDLFANLWYTIRLNLSSYLYATLIAFPLAFILGLFPVFDVLFGKYASALRFIPCPSLIGIFVAIFGLTFSTKAAFLTFAIVIFMIPEIVNTIHNLQNPKNDKDNVYLQTAHTLGMSSWQKLKYVYIPYVSSSVYNSLVGLTGISYSYVVISELIYKDGTINGIGSLINTMTRQSHMAEAYALILIVIAVGCLQDLIFRKLGKILFKFK